MAISLWSRLYLTGGAGTAANHFRTAAPAPNCSQTTFWWTSWSRAPLRSPNMWRALLRPATKSLALWAMRASASRCAATTWLRCSRPYVTTAWCCRRADQPAKFSASTEQTGASTHLRWTTAIVLRSKSTFPTRPTNGLGHTVGRCSSAIARIFPGMTPACARHLSATLAARLACLTVSASAEAVLWLRAIRGRMPRILAGTAVPMVSSGALSTGYATQMVGRATARRSGRASDVKSSCSPRGWSLLEPLLAGSCVSPAACTDTLLRSSGACTVVVCDGQNSGADVEYVQMTKMTRSQRVDEERRAAAVARMAPEEELSGSAPNSSHQKLLTGRGRATFSRTAKAALATIAINTRSTPPKPLISPLSRKSRLALPPRPFNEVGFIYL